MDHHPRSIVRGMFLGFSRGQIEGVFGDLGGQTVVGSECFLFSTHLLECASFAGIEGAWSILCSSHNDRAKSAHRLARPVLAHTRFGDRNMILCMSAFCSTKKILMCLTCLANRFWYNLSSKVCYDVTSDGV